MKLLADQDIAGVEDAFRNLGDLQLMPGRAIERSHLLDCQCLIVRTVTRVDADLLRDTAVEFVGTATIGTDHLDLDYLAQANIRWANATGCNAEAAAEYVVSGLFAMSRRFGFDPFRCQAGVVGCGNVGSRLYQILHLLGIDCLVCDPPLAESGTDLVNLVDLDTLLQNCDIISLHVPLTRSGPHPTHHLLDSRRLQRLNPQTVLINAARGAVIDNAALSQQLQQRDDLRVFLDTFEHEPNISRLLLRQLDLATPHIAGYSVEGRLRGTQMILDAISHQFGVPSSWHWLQFIPAVEKFQPPAALNKLDFWQRVLAAHCDIWRDHDALMAGIGLDDDAFCTHFDALRKNYSDRVEYQRCQINTAANPDYRTTLEALGFRTES